MERLAGIPAEVIQTEELYRKFQGILNKLTPQKFQSLAEQALKLEINTRERLSGCIDKIFTMVRICMETVRTQPRLKIYLYGYADICASWRLGAVKSGKHRHFDFDTRSCS